jgi:hypothetical protein
LDIFRIKEDPYERRKVLLFCPESGPFFSINWINMDNFSSFNLNNNIIYSAGLKYSLGIRWNEAGKRIGDNHTFFTVETGYRNMYGEHGFFLTIQINLIEYFWVCVIAA